MKNIEVNKIIDPIPASDGAGVKLKRSIGVEPNYFDDIFSIESVGIYKPDSRVYEMPIKKYDCKPENICFMSSNTWDVSGGGVFGYNAVWVNRLNKVFDKLSYKPKNVINNLEEQIGRASCRERV